VGAGGWVGCSTGGWGWTGCEGVLPPPRALQAKPTTSKRLEKKNNGRNVFMALSFWYLR